VKDKPVSIRKETVVVELLSQNLSGRNEKTTKPVRTGDPVEVRSQHLPNISLERYLNPKPLGVQ
jgi:hypothetical protein